MNRAARRKQGAGNAELNRLLQQGSALHQQGRMAEAEQCYGMILKSDPKQPDALQLQGLIDHQAGRLELAHKRMRQSLARKPEQPHVWYNLAKLLYQMEDANGAIEANSRALSYDATHVDALMNRAHIYTKMRDYHKAVADYEGVLALEPNHPHVWEPLALTLKEIGRQQDAIDMLRARLQVDSQQPTMWCALAKALRDQGEKAQAIEALQQALVLAPDYAEAHYNLSLIVTYQEDQLYNKSILESAVEAQHDSDDHIYLHFALAKAYDDLGDIDQAFTHYHKGNALKRAKTDYDVQQVAAQFKRIESICSKDYIDDQVEVASDVTPIFILGMPRSGTSLIEQILSSHSQVTGAGELNDLHYAIAGAPGQQQTDYVDKMARLSGNQLKRISKLYSEKLRAHGDTPFICDKMPMNFQHIGLIRKLLPQAKIIHVMRDPVNTCLSIYTRLFFGNQPFAYDQTELGQHYKLYEALMQHWRSVCGDALLELSYESVVEDTELQVRQLLAYCGLEWEEACLNFHQTKRSVDTASAMQVRQPIYRSSLDRAQRYCDAIQPLINALQE